MSRKRRRSQAAAAAADQEHSVEHATGVEINEKGHEHEERRDDHEIWAAFKEEHHEILEQLPLSLHRQYTLIRELDDQSEVYHTDLLDTLRAYIALRVQLASRLESEEALQNVVLVAEPLQAALAVGTGSSQLNGDSVSHNTKSTSPTECDARSLASSSIEPSASTATQEMLQHIAQISEEALRASQEKVNIAQTVYETADRHIRFLDQVIKEQEASITLGIRPGTNLASILLPDLVVPRWARPTRIQHSPTPSLSPEHPVAVPPQDFTEELHIESARPGRGRKTRKKPALCFETQPSAPEDAQKIPLARTTRSVKLKIPAQTDLKEPQIAEDPDEPRYCYCNQVSYGEMIACDDKHCKSEWFHLSCLNEVPNKRQEWYCLNCRTKITKGKER